MKPTTLSPARFGLILLLATFSIGLLSWDYQQTPGGQPVTANDTVPKKIQKEKKVRDLDEALSELEAIDISAEMAKVSAELSKAFKEFDGEKIRLEIEKAMKEVDLAKIQAEVQASMAKTDWNEVKEQIAAAIKEIDVAKIQQEVQASLAKVDWDKMKLEMEKVKETDFRKMEEDMKKMAAELKEMAPKLEKEMKKAKEEMEKAKTEMKAMKTLVDGLDSDGLLIKKEGYKLEHKNVVLLINGKKASEGVYKKYQAVLDKYPTFTLSKTDDDFDMNLD